MDKSILREVFTWGTTLLCLAGTVLNVKKSVLCFYLWTVGNVLWLSFDLYQHLYSRAVLDIVQLILALWGIKCWSKKDDDGKACGRGK
jgi:nicotinamide riboside transporter PnuC